MELHRPSFPYWQAKLRKNWFDKFNFLIFAFEPLTRKRYPEARYVDDVYPFIWNNFSDAGYATLYGEDGHSLGVVFNKKIEIFYKFRHLYISTERFSQYANRSLSNNLLPLHWVIEELCPMYRCWKTTCCLVPIHRIILEGLCQIGTAAIFADASFLSFTWRH